MNLKAIALLFLFNCIVAVLGQSGLTRDGFPYLIRQRQNENGTTELYSPYFLWNPLLRNTFTVLAEPLKVYSNKGKLDIKMTVEVATISTGLFSYRTRVYCYESICSTPGPTLIVKPGDLVRIELINRLENSSSTSALSQFSTEEFFPNRTNLFFQSLPIDPTINSPFRFTQGNGDSIFYTFRIRSNMPRGIHWYHSHVHGVSSLHVMGGLFGAVIIEEMDTASFPAYFTSVPRKTVVLSHLFIEPNASMYLPNIPNTHRFSLQDDDFETSSLSLKYLSHAFGSRIDLNVSYSNTSNFRTTDVWLVNNLFQPTYVTTPGAWVIFDIVVASGDRIVELEMRSALPGTVGSHRSCSMRLLGRNGYYFDQARKGEAVDHLILLQGDRASLAIMCPTNGTFFLTSLADTRESETYYHVGDWTTKSTQMIAQIQTYGVFNDNSSAIDATFQDLSFLRVDTPITNLLSKYNVQNAQTLPLFSLSTAQSSAPVRSRIPRDPCALMTAQAVNTSAYPYNHGPTAALSRYTIGAGVNCRNPCYDDVLCTALFGNDSYSVDDFTVAMNRECGFIATQLFNVGQNPLHCASTINVTQLVVDIWTNKTQFDTSSQQQGPQNVSQLLPGTISLTTSQRLYRMQLYGHASFPYPIYLQNHDVQVLSFDNVGVQTSNIYQRDEYAPRYNYDMGTYGYQVNDRRDSLLPLQGRMTFLVELAGADVSATTQGTALYPVLSTYLKFSDRGFLRFVHLNLQNDTSTDTNTTVPSPTPNPSPTPAPPTTLPTDKTITVNYTQGVEVDSNGQPFVCDITGRSSLYEERIDLTTMTRVIRMNSCPNHYSVCQSAQCGGEQKTRALKWYREVRVPLYPVLAAVPQDMTCAVDMVGIAANGVGIFSPAQGGVQSCVFFQNDTRSRFGRTSCVAGFRGEGLLTCGDSMHWNRRQLDKCGGYADEFYHNQNFSGLYRYTSLPTCLFHQLTVNATSSTSSSISSSVSPLAVPSTANAPRKGHSVQLGWAMDGFPIYGPVGIRGILMRRCGVAGAHPQICLDNCNGYYGRLPGVDEYLYRYYMTGNHTTSTSDVTAGEMAPKCSRFVRNSNGEQIERCDRLSSSCCRDTVPDGSFFPYTIGCFRGCVLSTDIAQETGVYTKNNCLLTSKKATTTSFIPQVLPSASSLYSDPESQALYSGPVASNAGRTISSSMNTTAATDAMAIGTSSSDNSSVSAATDATASLLRTTRRVLYRDPYDLSLDVFTTRRVTRDESTGSVVSVDIDGQVLGGIRNRESLAPEVASISYDETDGTVNTIVPEANADHFFSGMVVDHRCHMMYFTDQQRIYKQLLHPETAQPLTASPPTLVVAGIIKVDLFGYNLGRIYEDIVQIRVKDNDFCTSIVHVSSTHVSCLLISAIAAANNSVGSQLNAQDVMVRTVSGVTYGISLDALSQVEAGMTRPVLTRVHFSRLPLVPYGLSMVIDPMGDRASIPTTLMVETAGRTTAVSAQEAIARCQSGDDVTLYWTNTAATPLGHNIQRVRGSGTHLETIARGVRQGRGLFAMAALVDTRNTSLAFYDRSLWQIANLSASVDDNTRTVYNTYVVPRYDTTCLGTGYEYNRLIQRQGPSPVYPSDNRSELTYDVIMEYIESTGVDPRIYTSPCRYRLGHVLFVAEAGDTGRLVRLQVLPIQPNGLVFQPYLAYDASGLFRPDFDDVELAKDMSQASWTTYSADDTSSYSMVFYEQTRPQPVVVAWTTTLLHRVWSIQSIEADFVANRLYVTTRDHGLILSMDLSVLLDAQTTAATATATVVSTTSTEPQSLMTTWPMSFDIRSWQLACASPQLQANPLQWPVSWLRLIHCGNLVTRAHGLLVFPLALDALVPAAAARTNNDSATTIDVPTPWSLKQRLVLVDTNQQQLVAIREENMFTTRSTDLGRSFQLYFPHQLRWFASQTMTSAQGEAMIRHRLLVSEYLGRFWTVDVWSSLNNDTLWLDDVTLKPALVLDWSAFTASIKVREVLANNRLEGAASYDTIFFEASP